MASFQNACVSCYGPNPPCERGEAYQISTNATGTKIIYGAGQTVVIRDVANPSECEVYTEHKAQVTVAKFSPNGNYVASGDAKGIIRIWAYDHPDKLLKKEMPCLGGKILDLAWDGDGKRIVVGGATKTMNARVFIWDTGSPQGEISGATKNVLSVDLRPTNPGRLITASEDMKSRIYFGPPYKFKMSNNDHTNFVQCVRFSPDGSMYATVSNDSNIFIFNADSGEKIGNLPVEHKGSIYSCAWKHDSTHLITASGDKTVRVWNVKQEKCVATLEISPRPQVADMQVGCVYAGEQIVSVSLSGDLNYLDMSSPKMPKHVIQANSAVPSAVRYDWVNGNGKLYSGSNSGEIVAFDQDGTGIRVTGDEHNGKIAGIHVTKGVIYTVGWDDYLRCIDAKSQQFVSKKLPLGSQPRGVSASLKHPDLVVVVTNTKLLLIRSFRVVDEIVLEGKYDPLSVSMSPGGSEVAVGGGDKKVYVYKVSKDKLHDEKITLPGLQGAATVVAHSPNGKYIAVGDKVKEITLWDRKTFSVIVKNKWVFHTAAITDLAFSPNSEYMASTSVDSAVIVWNVKKPLKKTKLKLAHSNGSSSVTWASDDIIYSGGGDLCVKQWKPTLP